MTGTVQVGILVVVLGFLTENTIVFAAEPADDTSPKQTTPEAAKPKIPKGHIALNPSGTVILDRKGKRLLLTTEVVLREGFLEMLCCRKFTKEHESLLSLDAKAYVVHTGLLALGAEPGEPVQYYPKYQPASGPRIDIFLHWTDKKGKPHNVMVRLTEEAHQGLRSTSATFGWVHGGEGNVTALMEAIGQGKLVVRYPDDVTVTS